MDFKACLNEFFNKKIQGFHSLKLIIDLYGLVAVVI